MLIMGVGGGAVFPPIQGAIADTAGTPTSQLVPMIGYCLVLVYACFLAEPFGKKKFVRDDVEIAVDEKIRDLQVVDVKA